jgi:hypothetical protein
LLTGLRGSDQPEVQQLNLRWREQPRQDLVRGAVR